MDREVYRFFTKREHHRFRKEVTWDLAGEYTRRGLSLEEQVTDRFERACLTQTPVILPGEQIVYFRTVGVLPPVANPQGFRHVNNVCPDYYSTIAVGLLEKRKTANVLGQRTIDAIIGLADRYLEEARRQNDRELEAVLARVPRYGARTFREALQFFRILHFSLWLEGDYHNTVGRFDQKMYPYLQQDLEAGRLTRETALALLEDFFLSFCKDYDLYEGIQVGDNGQSLMLGGINEQGEDVFNLLSQLCLEASCNNKLIDPKINLRVSKSTPLERFEMATRLTEAGLGFPQYSNDDVVIPALEKLGYDHCDAVNYTVAACWEFIIPHVGMDVVNIDSLSYPQELDNALHKDFLACRTYQEFFEKVKQALNLRIREICDKTRSVTFLPAPLMEILNGFDPNTGGKYHNYGIHGTGLSTAADSLAAIKKYVYEEKTVTRERLLAAVDSNFEEEPELLHMLRYEAPKMGNNDDYVDSISIDLMNAFADALEGQHNSRGGIYRAGTGSAMCYLWDAKFIGASPDGRRRNESFGANFSISLFARPKGPVSVMASMTKQPFHRVINGGPLTMEFHRSVFNSPGGRAKVAALVQSFIRRSGHQLQLNTVNAEQLRNAQRHPEQYRQLIVRVWGWSAYFVELDKEFQDHIIARQVYGV